MRMNPSQLKGKKKFYFHYPSLCLSTVIVCLFMTDYNEILLVYILCAPLNLCLRLLLPPLSVNLDGLQLVLRLTSD